MYIEGVPRLSESGPGSHLEAVPKTMRVAHGVAKTLGHEIPAVEPDVDLRTTVDELFASADKTVHAIMHRICQEM